MADAKKSSKGGRPSKLTREVTENICKAIRAGNFFGTACQYAGIDESTGYAWMQAAKGEHPRLKQSKQFVEFSEAVKKAEADAEAAAILRIGKAARGGELATRTTKTVTKVVTKRNGDVEETTTTTVEEGKTLPQWQADAWFLERKFSDRWGRKDPIKVQAELTGKDGGPIQTEGGQVVVLLPSNGRDDGPEPVTAEDMPVLLPGNGREDDGHDTSQ